VISLRAAFGALALASAAGAVAIESCFSHASRRVEARRRVERDVFERRALAAAELAGRYARGAEELALRRSGDFSVTGLWYRPYESCALPSTGVVASGRWSVSGSRLELRIPERAWELQVGQLEGRRALLDERGAWIRIDGGL
jgi:hypothetical protein